MKKIFILLGLLFSVVSFGQNQASNWFFGDGAGIKFEQDGSITANSGQLFTDEGCTSISDKVTGELLFYTDGITVYDTNGNPMPNGFALKGNPSSTQSGLIVPKPQDDDIFYIFTVDTAFQGNPDEGFHFSEVDMRLNGGLGDVVAANKNTNLLADSTEKIAAVLQDCQTENIWVVTLANNTGNNTTPNQFNTFHAFQVTATGVNTTAVQSPAGLTLSEQRGNLKFSPDGSKLASANIDEGTYLYEFDINTGMVTSNPISLSLTTPNNGAVFSYGLEFSPNSNLLYVSSYNNFFNGNNPSENNNPDNHFASLIQFDVSDFTQATIQASETLLDQRNSYRSALQLGPDLKIYRTSSQTYNIGQDFLTVINNPNEVGLACDYDYNNNRIDLNGNNSRQGLPPFIASFFTDTVDIINDPNSTEITTFLPLCEGDSYTLTAENIPGATYTWSANGVDQPTPTIPYEFEIFANGLYRVVIDLNTTDCETQEGVAQVEYSGNPEAVTPAMPASSPNQITIAICDDNANDGVFQAFDFTQLDAEILNGQDPADFSVLYYRTAQDAEDDMNVITFPYENESNPQEIFVRVQNNNNGNCFTTLDANTNQPISYNIQVYNTPAIETLNDIEDCDTEGDTEDGVITFTLSDYNDGILGASQDSMDYTITYHSSNADAMTGNMPLNNTYQNQPFNDTVYVRVENNANTNCFVTDRFTITINLTPNVNDIGLFQCDEDGTPDGRTVFNILEAEEDITGGNPNFSVAYYLNTIDAEAEMNAIDAGNFNNTLNPQIIIARVTDTTSDCFSYSEVTLEVSATSANDAYLGVCDTDGDEDGFTTFDLSMADAQILDGLPAGLELAYYETLDDALLEQNELPNDFTNAVVDNQTIFARVENDNNCYGINEVELEVLTLPNVIIEEEVLYCLNEFPEPIKINGGVVGAVPNNFFYNWSTGETTIEIEVNAPGIYTVVVSNVAGCQKTRTVTVVASNTATIDNVEVTDAVENNTVTVLASGEGDYEYSLDDPNGVFQDSNTFTNVRPGVYTVFVRDKNGCGVVEETISVIGFPNFFTPNGDGQNDYWQVKGVSSQFQPDTVIYIFDRHGKLISEVNPLGSGWDGYYNGNLMPNSDYWFSVTLQDGRRFSSHFTLKR